MGILQQLKKHRRLELSLLLIGMSLVCLTLFIIRFWVTGSIMFLFLNWNLFLAFIPWVASSLIITHPRFYGNKMILLGMLGIWILFFPNSPYILTDLFHLRTGSAAPIWFDLVLILSFAWTGLMYGFVSLLDIERLMRTNFNKPTTGIFIIFLLFLSGFGIYLGRYLRWNSWDIIQDPTGLLYDIGQRFTNPLEHPRTWGLTVLMGLLLNMIFWSIRFVRKNDDVCIP